MDALPSAGASETSHGPLVAAWPVVLEALRGWREGRRDLPTWHVEAEKQRWMSVGTWQEAAMGASGRGARRGSPVDSLRQAGRGLSS